MSECAAHVRFQGQSGHDGLHGKCPLVAQADISRVSGVRLVPQRAIYFGPR